MFDILLVAPHNHNNMKTWQTSSSLGFLASYSVLHVKRSPIRDVRNPPIDAAVGVSSAICTMDIDWPTSLIALRILQSLVLPLDAALLLGMPTIASLAAASQTWLLFVCLPAFRLANPLANGIARGLGTDL